MARVLVVDDDADVRAVVTDLLRGEGHEVTEAHDGIRGFDVAVTTGPDVVITDIRMPRTDGVQLLEKLRSVLPDVPVIMLTAAGEISTAVDAMRAGAFDYVAKPFDAADLLVRVERAVGWRRMRSEVEGLRREVGAGSLRMLAGSSPAMREVITRIAKVADSTLTVLVQGETGTGKELVARAIHETSSRRDAPLIALDCAAIPETLVESELFGHERGAFTGAERRKDGHFRLAEGGTLFLDEVENLPGAAQAKLLRVIQEREVWPIGARAPVRVDVRIVAATNVGLEAEAKAGRFRLDLFYRLNEFAITLPPLRERRGDVLELARRFLVAAVAEFDHGPRGFDESAEAALLAHTWPGNVRELRNVARRAALLSTDLVRGADLGLPAADHAPPPAAEAAGGAPAIVPLKRARDEAVADAERRMLLRALTATRGNKSEAARLLEVDVKTIHTKVKQYGLSV